MGVASIAVGGGTAQAQTGGDASYRVNAGGSTVEAVDGVYEYVNGDGEFNNLDIQKLYYEEVA